MELGRWHALLGIKGSCKNVTLYVLADAGQDGVISMWDLVRTSRTILRIDCLRNRTIEEAPVAV